MGEPVVPASASRIVPRNTSIPRPRPQGSIGEIDMHAAQQHVPLMHVQILAERRSVRVKRRIADGEERERIGMSETPLGAHVAKTKRRDRSARERLRG
jgi:hypothetical protein